MIGYELRNATHFVNFTSRLSVCQLYGPERDFPCLLGGGSFRIRDAVFRTSEVSPKTCHTSGRQSAAQPPKATARATKLSRCYAYSEAEPRRFAVTPRAARVSGRESNVIEMAPTKKVLMKDARTTAARKRRTEISYSSSSSFLV